MAFDSLFNRWRDQEQFVPRSVTVNRPRSAEAQAALETGLAEFVALREQCSQLAEDRDRAFNLCSEAKNHIIKLQEQIAQLKDEMAEQAAELKARSMTYQIERDESVAKYAKLQAFLISLFAQMRAFDVPAINTADLVQELPPMDLRVPKPASLPGTPRPPTPDEMLAKIDGRPPRPDPSEPFKLG